MNKLVRTGAIALSFALVAGGASAAKWNWDKTDGGFLNEPSNWSDGGSGKPSSIDPADVYRIRATQEGDAELKLNGEFRVNEFDFGYSTYEVNGTLNLGKDNTIVCENTFDVVGKAVGRLVSGTISVLGDAAHIGRSNGGDGETRFILDGPDAKLTASEVSGRYVIIGYGFKTNSCLEVINGAKVDSARTILVGYDSTPKQNTLLISGQGSEVATQKDVELGNNQSSCNNVTVTDGAKLSCRTLYIGSNAQATSNVVTVANGATISVVGAPGKGNVVHLGKNSQLGNEFVVSNAVVDLLTPDIELYHPSQYSNATIRVAGTDTCLTLSDHNDSIFHATQRLVLDISGPQLQDAMVEGKSFTFEEGSKLYITSSVDLTKVPSFEVVAIANRNDTTLSTIPEGVVEIDPECADQLEVVLETRSSKLIVRHTKKAQVLGTQVYFH